MPASCETALQQRCQQIVTSPVLTPEQKRHFLALEAENALPYPPLPEDARQALDEGVICDMFEGHAPFKPRYVLPDYARFLANGSQWLELEGAKDLDDALSLLTILYHHVPSVTSMPVYLGQLDALLQPYVRILTQDAIDIRIKRFWRYLDRTLPDAFMHANIGPADTPVTRAILRADAELKQVTPNLTFIYDAEITPDDLLLEVAKNICECSKPHISNGPVNDKIFTKGHYGIVSCYNSLPLVGGGRQLLAVQGDIAAFPLMAFNKLHRLDKHPRRAAAGVINFALERFEHFGQQRHHAFRRIELAPAFAFGCGKLAEEVFVHATDKVFFRQRFHVGFVGQRFDVIDGVDKRRQLLGFQILTAEVVVRQRAFQRRVALLNGGEGGINAYGDIVLLSVLLDERPARFFRQVEDVVLLIEDFHFEEIALAFVFHLFATGFKLIANKFEEHEAQHHVLVLGGFNAAAKLVRGIP